MRALARPDGADLGHRHLEVGEDLEQERLELLVAAVDLVDQQDRRPAFVRDGLQQRPLEQERLAEDLRLGVRLLAAVALLKADVQELARVVPLVEGGRGVEAFVALQPDQVRPEQAGEHLGDLGLPHARMTLDEQRLAQLQREMQRGRDGRIGHVRFLVELLEQLRDAIQEPPRGGGVKSRERPRRQTGERGGSGWNRRSRPLECAARTPRGLE